MATNYFPELDIKAPQQQDILGNFAKFVDLRNALQTAQYQQQLQPLELQKAQLGVQQSQMDIDSQKGLMQAYIDAKGDPDKALSLAASGPYKVLPKDMLAFQNQQVEYQKNLATKNETELKNLDTQGYNLRQLIDPIVQADPADQPGLFAQVKQKVLADPARAIKYGITDPSQIPDYQGPQQIALYDAALTGHQQAISDAQKQAQAGKDIQEAAKAKAEIPGAAAEAAMKQAAQTSYQQWQAQPQNIGKTFDQYQAETAALKAGAEAKARLPYEMQLASFNRQTAMGNVLAEHAMNTVTDMFTNPQHGYSQTLAQLSATKSAIANAQNGDQLAASLSPLMTALGVVSFAGLHRINQYDVDAAGPQVGSVLRQIDAKLSKLGSGKLAAGTAGEMSGLMDSLLDAKYNTVVQGARVAAANGGVDPGKVMVMGKTGNLVPLAQAAQGGGGAGGDMVTVQIPGMQPGQIPRSKLDQFKRDHPKATIGQ